ncbi:formylglycine-generating enzyme family protein [Sorangium cellulosum]|uniref:formylglycine-generating enzyme family protein n=1 Tax=Sorangium cellulosum TaxID=56 RepID=UPI001F3FF503|nr:SUMF1/EgtB/PvdO family nonheme iron enzyme [Sorangium cellulosum]
MPGEERSARALTGRALALAASLAGLLCAAPACDRGGPSPGGDAALDAAPPWDVGQTEPEPRPGMAWIPKGVLIAGTPPDRLPRIADEEMAGEQVVMHGFYIDVFSYPNEVGAIPTTNVTQDEARALCEAQDKRLCTELEIERACKGPANTTYEYGDTYRPSVCATGQSRVLTPNGVNAGCASAFGVHDLHGGVWTWTASQWQRDTSKPGLVTLRGGNGPAGELVGRCANGRGVKPDTRRPEVGVRCCAGEVNSFEVVLEVARDRPLRLEPLLDTRVAAQLAQLAPEEVRAAAEAGRAEDAFKVERMWTWHPRGNEELVLGGGCARAGGERGEKAAPQRSGKRARRSPPGGDPKLACGLIIARMRLSAPALLAFVSSDRWQPTLGETDSPRDLLLYGGDALGAFRRRVTYEWGKIAVADKERKRKHKGRRGLSYD